MGRGMGAVLGSTGRFPWSWFEPTMVWGGVRVDGRVCVRMSLKVTTTEHDTIRSPTDPTPPRPTDRPTLGLPDPRRPRPMTRPEVARVRHECVRKLGQVTCVVHTLVRAGTVRPRVRSRWWSTP